MKLVFCFAGKTFKGSISELVNDYVKRISRYAPVEVIEAKTIKKQERQGVHVVLSPYGETFTSEEFANYIEAHLNASTRHMFFYTGFSEGYREEFEKRSDLLLSFSRMTFNHQIIRINLLEQVYRAFTIIKGEKYHK